MDGFIFFVTAIGLYFVPTIIAWNKDHDNLIGIFFLNLLTGWSLIGWIAAFIWACIKPTSPR